jgi:lipopolysaccharide biosynthesis regulator YciM
VIDRDPTAVDPYLQLGNLLRLTGDPKRAAVLHRNLTVRPDVPREKRVSIALSLAEDLLALARWEEAGKVLDSLQGMAQKSPRYWRARFAQLLGLGKESEAARSLRSASQDCAQPDAAKFQEKYWLFQADRALRSSRSGQMGEAKRLLKDVPREGPAAAKGTFVQALLAAQAQDAEKAITVASEGLTASPEEMALFFPALREALFASGQYTKAVAILEAACQAEQAPPSLWIALALLYDKLGDRDKAIGFLEGKAHDPRLTPNAAAPYLKLLAEEHSETGFGRIWRSLHMPGTGEVRWLCSTCSRQEDAVRWFCPGCLGFDTYEPVHH